MANYIESRNTKKEKKKQSARKNTYEAAHYNSMYCRSWEMK
jgi:hypothetical protein